MSNATGASPGSGASHQRPDVQGLRALAVLLVVAFHGGLGLAGGFVGVDAFFVISGFVITGMLLRERRAEGRVDFGRFFRRRFWRLVPLLALVVGCTIVASTFLLSPEGTQQVTAKTAIGAMAMAANAVVAHVSGGYFDAPAHANPLLNTWSLSVEQQFYVLFPAVLVAAWAWQRRGGPRRAALWATLALAAGSFALALGDPGGTGATAAAGGAGEIGASGTTGAAGSGAGSSLDAVLGALGPALRSMLDAALFGFYSPLPRAWEFAAGAALALLGPCAAARSARTGTWLGGLGLALLLASALFLSASTPFPGPWTLLPVAGTALLVAAGSGAPNAVSAVLSLRPLVALGDWSYAVYLWHWPLIVLAQVLWPGALLPRMLAVLVSFPLAAASHRFVEQPLRALGRAPSRSRARAPFRSGAPSRTAGWRRAAVVVGVPMAMAGALHGAAQSWFGNEAARLDRTAVAAHPTGLDDTACSMRAPVESKNVAACRWHAHAPGPPIYLLGDSNAQQFSDALIGTGLALGRPVTTLTTAGCPFIDAWLQLEGQPGFDAECRRAFVSALGWMQRQRPGTVLVASVDRYWHDPHYRASLDGRFERRARAHAGNAAVLNEGLARSVRALQAAGHAVVLIQTVPQFVSRGHRMQHAECTGWEVIAHACERPYGAMPRHVADTLQRASREGLGEVAARTGARLVDFRDFFCPGGACTTRRDDGLDLYMPDGYHLNRAGSSRLRDEFMKLLA